MASLIGGYPPELTVPVSVAVDVTVGVTSFVAVGVCGVAVWVEVGVTGVGVWVDVAVGSGVKVGVWVGVLVGVWVGVDVPVGVGGSVGVREGGVHWVGSGEGVSGGLSVSPGGVTDGDPVDVGVGTAVGCCGLNASIEKPEQ